MRSAGRRRLSRAYRVPTLDFDKANEILFRLGIIYKQQGKYTDSLECFDRILRNPPSPLAHADIWFQIGHVFEQQRDVRTLSHSSEPARTDACERPAACARERGV